MSKKGSRERQELVAAAIQTLGGDRAVAKLCHVDETRVRNWVHEGRINRYHFPDLIRKAHKMGVHFPWVYLVQGRARVLDWSMDRIRLEEIFILLGGQKRIGENLKVTGRSIKYWGQRAGVPRDHLLPFLRLCRAQFKRYTGKSLPIQDYIVGDVNLDIYRLYLAFKRENLVFGKRKGKNSKRK